MTVKKLKEDAEASVKARHEVVHPTDEQLYDLVEECVEYVDLMQAC